MYPGGIYIVNVAIVGHTAGVLGTLGVGNVNHPQSSAALETVLSAYSGDKVSLLVGNQVVAAAEAVEVSSQVAADAVGGRVLGISLLELGEVEDLKTVVGGLRANVGVVANDLDVAPGGGDGLGRETADVGQAAVRLNLDEGSAISLAEKSKLAARRGGPAPDVVTYKQGQSRSGSRYGYTIRTDTGAAVGVLVTEEALEVDVVAAVLAGLAINTGGGTGGLVTVDVVHAIGLVLLELGHLALTQSGHADSIGSAGSLEGVGLEVGSLDVLSRGTSGQAGKEDGSN